MTPGDHMDPTIKAEWVAALRSGDFKQGKTALCRHAQYCCLGVLCELAVSHDITTKHEDTFESAPTGSVVYGASCMSLPPFDVTIWAGLTSTRNNHLVHMNDAEGKSFAEIADYIEANL